MEKNIYKIGKELFITNDEEIKEGDAYITKNGEICKSHNGSKILLFKTDKKIILTTDEDLITEGIQQIDDEFLEWFVKNPSCESVQIKKEEYNYEEYRCYYDYKIIIPKEEPKQDLEKEMFELEQELDIPSHLRWYNSKPKQETPEEAIERLYGVATDCEGDLVKSAIRVGRVDAFYDAIKWQQEQDNNKWNQLTDDTIDDWLDYRINNSSKITFKEWFEQFKKK